MTTLTGTFAIETDQVLGAGATGATGPAGPTGPAGSLFSRRTIYAAGASGTHVCDARTTAVRAFGVGGGSAGGGADATASNCELGSGGGDGGYFEKAFAVTGSDTITYAVGVGGTGVLAASGNVGTPTTVVHAGSSTSCATSSGPGGNRGGVGTAMVVMYGGLQGTATGGDINGGGAAGSIGMRVSAIHGLAPDGATSVLGGGGKGTRSTSSVSGDGGDATVPGSGGGGAANFNNSPSAGNRGGHGCGGLLILDEFGAA